MQLVEEKDEAEIEMRHGIMYERILKHGREKEYACVCVKRERESGEERINYTDTETEGDTDA